MQKIKYWQSTGNTKIREIFFDLVTSFSKDPFNGIGKPEPLKYVLILRQSSYFARLNGRIQSIDQFHNLKSTLTFFLIICCFLFA